MASKLITQSCNALMPDGRASAMQAIAVKMFRDSMLHLIDGVHSFMSGIYEDLWGDTMREDALINWEKQFGLSPAPTDSLANRALMVEAAWAMTGYCGPGYIQAALQFAGFDVVVKENDPAINLIAGRTIQFGDFATAPQFGFEIFNSGTYDGYLLGNGALRVPDIRLPSPDIFLVGVEDPKYWKGSQLTIANAGEGNGVYRFEYMQTGKPVFTKPSPSYNSIFFSVDRWYMWSTTPEPDNVIYRQTAANAWPWEGTWEVVPDSGATDAPDTPSAFLGTDGTAYWTGMKVNVSGAGTTLVNGDLPFTGWAYGKPRFALGLSKTVYAQSDGKYKIVKGVESLYLATTATDWPWEATYALIGGSSGVNPAPKLERFTVAIEQFADPIVTPEGDAGETQTQFASHATALQFATHASAPQFGSGATDWAYVFTIESPTGELALIPSQRRPALESLVLRLKPAHLGVFMRVRYN